MAGREIAAIITNYNMPERTDKLCVHIKEQTRWPVEVFVVDNGSDKMPPSEYTTLHLEKNIQTTGGWLAGLEQVRAKGEWLAYWFLITSAEFVNDQDPLALMAELLISDENAVGVHPALTVDSTSDWPHLFSCGGDYPRRTWHLDNIASLYRAEWFDAAGGFDPKMTYAWGIDLEIGWKARRDGRGLYIHEGCSIKKITDIGYKMGRMNMTADERRVLADAQMFEVLGKKYGTNWWKRMTGDFVTEEMLMSGEFRGKERAICLS